MAVEIDGQLFHIGEVRLTEAAKDQCVLLQRKNRKDAGEDEAASVHAAILLKLHATGQYGNIHYPDKILNSNNIQRNSGRVLSVIGAKFPFVILTSLPSGDTIIMLPEEV